jgi:dipeptidyl aminopeptidase/acylaminoacyl peptidase
MFRIFSQVAGLVCCALVIPAVADASEWPYPEDIPETGTVTVGLAGEAPADIVRYLMAAGALEARISPDGKLVAYSSRVTGEPQLWIVDATGGASTQLTFGSGIATFYWAPDSKNIVVARDAEGNERNGYYLLSTDGTQERVLLPQSEAYRQFGMFSNDGRHFLYSTTERNGRDFDIYMADLEGGQPRLIYEGAFGFFPMSWQPGGDLVLVNEIRGEDANDVHILDVSNGELVPLFQPEVAASYADFAWLPDGSGFFMATNQDREYAGLAFYSLREKTLSFKSTPGADVSNVSLSPDGLFLVWTTNEDGYSKLHGTSVDDGRDMVMPGLPAGVYTVAFAKSAPVLIVGISGPAIPGDVWTWNPASREAAHAIRSTLAGLDPASIVIPEPLSYKARDGVTLHGLLYRPTADYCTEPPPVVIDVHGGPTAQSRPSFQATTQYLVNVCVAVFDVNVRGSTGYGKTYARLDNQEKRLDSVRDLVDTAEFLARDELLDTDRMAVMGGSYGGYMVNAVLGAYPDVFDAGISMVGVSDWVRALEEASPFLKASDRIEYGDIRKERWQEFYRQNSPINTAHRIKVPVLIQHGANDPRDPVTESDRIVRTIRDNEGTVRYMRFPDEGHSLRKQENRVAFYRAVAEFLEENM